MKCPTCKEPIIVLELNEVEIDYCPSCGGIWLDTGELDLLIEDEKEREILLSSFHKDAEHSEKPYKCPMCRKKMDKVHVGENKDVLIDKCPDNDGLWFDKGELKDVIKLASKDNKVVELLNDLFGSKLINNQSGEN
ncbi:MAG: zf-TFIIB domain-containing protein [Ignavibacteria bacterium]|nr:zf-TFIIB domain-containing protein [Ignavibacteria bacterium]